MRKAQNFKQFHLEPSLLLKILCVLKKNAIKSISMKKAQDFYDTKLVSVCFQKLLMNRQI